MGCGTSGKDTRQNQEVVDSIKEERKQGVREIEEIDCKLRLVQEDAKEGDEELEELNNESIVNRIVYPIHVFESITRTNKQVIYYINIEWFNGG